MEDNLYYKPKTIIQTMRIVKISAFLLLILVFTLVTVRFLLLDRFVTMALQRAGAYDITFHIADISTDQIQIDILAASLDLPNGKIIHAKAKGISLQYSLEHLLMGKKCDMVLIQEMEISRSGIKKDVPPTRLPEKIILLKDNLRTLLPLEKLKVNRVLLHGDLPEQFTERVIKIEAAVDGTAIDTTATLQMDADTVLTVVLQSPDSVHTTVDITGRQQQTDIFQAKVILQPDGVSGTINLQLSPVRNLMLQAVDLSKIPEIDGRMDGSFTVPLPFRDDSNLKTKITLIDNDDQQIHLEINGTPDTKQVSLLLTGQVKDKEFLNTNLALKQQRISGSYLLQVDLLRKFLVPYLKQTLPEISGSLSGDIDIPLPGSEEKTFSTTIRTTSAVLPGFTASSARMQLSGTLEKDGIILDSEALFKAGDLVIGNTKIRKCSLDLAGNFSRIEDQFRLSFAEQQNIRIKGITAGKTHIADLHLRPKKGLQVDLNKKTWSWSIGANTVNVAPLLIKIGSNSFKTGPLTCAIPKLTNAGAAPELTAAVTTPTFIYSNKKIQLPVKELTGTFQLKGKKVGGKIQFAPETIPGRVQASFTHDLATAAGSFTMRTNKRLDLNSDGISLANLMDNWWLPMDLDKGKISFKTNGSWATNRKFRLSAFVAVTKGSGYYKKFLFEGIDMRQDLTILPRLRSNTEGSFKLQQLIGGLDAHDIRTKVAFLPTKTGKQPKIQINDFNASLLDGTVTSPAISYDLNQPDSKFTVNIQSMDLAAIVDLVKMKGLHVTGKISGAIPVIIKGKAISVDNGKLYNDPPGGEISYRPKNMNAAGLTGYALKAVKDFRYTSLKTTAKYAPSGQLDLDIGLQGISPELDATRPVHLNIHAEQNLPALMQSLRYSKGLTEELNKRVQQRYE